MRDIQHHRDDRLPPPMHELPWMRRERADANIRRAINDLRALVREDTLFAPQYQAMADAFETALELVNAIEDFKRTPPPFTQHSRKVTL